MRSHSLPTDGIFHTILPNQKSVSHNGHSFPALTELASQVKDNRCWTLGIQVGPWSLNLFYFILSKHSIFSYTICYYVTYYLLKHVSKMNYLDILTVSRESL